MKQICSLVLLALLCATGRASTNVYVHNTSNSIEGCTGCTYEVKLRNLTFTKTGSLNWGYSESGYTSVTPGNTKTWTLNPPSGYTPNWSTLTIDVRYCSTIVHSYGNSGPVVEDYNNCGCAISYYATYWFRNADGDYDIQCEAFFRMQGETGQVQATPGMTIGETVQDMGSTVSPNPSAGTFTLFPGKELAGRSYSAQVTDATGRVVYSHAGASGDSPLHLDLAALPKGLYLLVIVSGNSRIQHRLVKE